MSKRRVSLLFALVGLSFVVLLLLGTISNLNPGLGFGRDLRLIIDVKESPNQLIDFLMSQRSMGREIQVDSISDTIKMISISGVSDLQTFLSQVSSQLWRTTIMELGTFGSLSNLGQFMFTLEFYVTVFVLTFAVYWLIRYKTLGLFSVLTIFVIILGSLTILKHLSNPFTHVIWFSMLLSFCFLLFQQKMLISYISSDTFTNSNEMDQTISRNVRTHAIVLAFFSLVLYATNFGLTSSARYFALIAVFMIVLSFVLPFSLKSVRDFMIHEKHNQYFLSLNNFRGYSSDKSLRVWGSVVVMGLIAVLVGGILFNNFNVRSRELYNEYESKTLFLIEAEDAQSFIEMHASFATHDVLNDQITFFISDERSMWFFYNENVNIENLEIARDSIEQKINVTGNIFEFSSTENPMGSPLFYFTELIFVILGFMIANTHPKYRYGIVSIVLNILSLAICSGWFSLFSLGHSRITVLLFLSIPILNAFFIITTPKELKDYSWSKCIVYATVRLGTIMMIIGIPVLLIIPSPSDNILVMISSLIIWSLSTVCSFIFYPLIMKGSKHEILSKP
ncbi:hypothetical protein AOC36_04085 [Erysipelothrix larvae]|uniref:Uncharacterized protein n=1 Tax=Erysipelothrix larvae TaxID=1514105 RepID=A0A0X8GZM9_9FIRM|nr:hypothetical protein [Erysipelothrix larvae]AMC93179.1 hypothetical protein AOC36_04085 [Erysipelothrix larvae]